MRNHNVKANDIYRWIEEYMRGNSTDYFIAKEDTSDAIVIFQSLLYKRFGNCADTMEYLIDRLDLSGAMPPNDSEYDRNSYYRAFLSLYNDSAVNFRLSRHNSTESSTEKGWARDGEPGVQYNLILEKVESTSKNPQITHSTSFHGVWVEVCHISLSDFNDDGNKRWDFIRKVVNYLTYGKPFNNESKTIKDMKTNKIRLTESQLRNMIAEAVRKTLNEISTDTAIAAHKKAQNDIDNAEFRWDDYDAVDKYDKRKRQADKFAQYAQDNGAQYYPYGLIGWYNDDSDGVFDRSEVIYSDSIDDIPDDGDGIYALTREGKDIYEEWREDASAGYDLCYGRMKGLAQRIGGSERDIWRYLTSNTSLSKKIKY